MQAVPLALLVLMGCSGSPTQVTTPKHAVTNEYHGVKIEDDFQWLENASDPQVRAWSAAQNQRARAVLDKLPARPFLAARLEQFYSETSPDYFGLTTRRGKLFLLKFQPPAQQPVLLAMNSPDDWKNAKVVFDPNQSGTNGSTSIDWYVPSTDGKLVAVSLSENGSEEGTLSIFEISTGKKLADTIPRVQFPTGGGSAAWNSDSSGLFYTRYPKQGERPDHDLMFYQQVYFHKLGTPVEQDALELGKDLPRIAEISLQASPDGRYTLATVANGDGGDFAHYLRDPPGHWKQITRFEDQIKQAEFGRDPLYIELPKDNALYLRSTMQAPKGKILRLPFDEPDLTNAATIVAEGTNTIQDFRPTASGLCVVYMKGGPSQLAFFDMLDQTERDFNRRSNRRGRSAGSATSRGPNFGVPTAIQQLVVTHGDEVLLRTETFTEPYLWWRYDPNKDKEKIDHTPLAGASPVSFEDMEAVRVQVASADGTLVPLNIVRKRGMVLDGERPTLLTGYGGYGISETPEFDFTRRVWLDQGGVIAVANLRGGGEFGEEWHKAGNLTRKQNVFDDFAACAQLLINSNYTKPSKLAIEGGSNGGLLMGAMLTQHPELMQAVVSHVGIYDMLRVELDPNGAFNVTEFGSVKDADQFQALWAYSPYHHVKGRTPYPAVLLLTGENDGRVNPAHSRKMLARLQSASSSKRPALLRTSGNSGHGIGTALNERIQQLADVYAFLFEQLGMDYTLVERGPWSGAVTPTSATVKAKLPLPGMTARLAVSQNPLLTPKSFTEPAHSETNSGNVVAFTLENLKPATRYYYALEVDGRLDRPSRGEFQTFPPPGPASFTFAFASCARTGSTNGSFDRIRENHPLFFMNTGDFHYLDIQTNSRARFRAGYDQVLASPQQAELYRHVAFVYMWDDHDFTGNNSDKKSKAHVASRLTYEEYVPHYPLAFGEGDIPISQSFSVGRVKFILTDLRSERDEAKAKDDAKKSMLGSKQKEWFKNELLEANGKYPLICWVSSVPWIGDVGKSKYRSIMTSTNRFGYFHHTNLVESVRTNRYRPPPPIP